MSDRAAIRALLLQVAGETMTPWLMLRAQIRPSRTCGQRPGRGSTMDRMTSAVTPEVMAGPPAPTQPDASPALQALHENFRDQHLAPLWTEIGDLMPAHPRSRAVPHLWRWERLRVLAAQAGDLVPLGRGGERRAIALANPSLDGRPFATPTLWAAIQYLMPRENAPEHRHTQHAFRFIVEGAGVWTVVGGTPYR